MKPTHKRTQPSIVFGVTTSQSVKLLGQIPSEMAGKGWQVHIVSSPGPELKIDSRSKVTTHQINMHRQPHPISDFLALLQWVTLISKLRPDVVSIGTPKAALLGLLASFFCQVPSRVDTLRGLRLETTKGIQRRVLWLFEALTSFVSTDILSVSPSLSKLYIRLGLAKESKIRVLGKGSSHGVDTSVFSPLASNRSSIKKRLGLGKGTPVLGFVGRLSADKGADTILQLHKYLRNRSIEHQFLLVGPIEDEKNQFRELIDSKSTVAVGYVPALRDYYEVMDILILPTLREGFPNVVLEAAATGIPAITTNATGAIDSVIDHVTGLVVEKRNAIAFCEATEMLLGNQTLRLRLGRRAQKWAKDYFHRPLVTSLTISYYDFVMTGRSKRKSGD